MRGGAEGLEAGRRKGKESERSSWVGRSVIKVVTRGVLGIVKPKGKDGLIKKQKQKAVHEVKF